MHAPASRLQPSARSRMLSSTSSARAERSLGDVVSGVVHGVSGIVHDASDVAHDVGHDVDNALSGELSKIPGDIVKTGIDVVHTGKDAVDAFHSAVKLSSGPDAGGADSASGGQSHSSGGGSATQPTPTANPGAGGGEGDAPTPSRSLSSQAPASTSSLASSTSPSSEYNAPAPSTASNTGAGATNVASDPSYARPATEPTDLPSQGNTGPTYGKTMMHGVPSGPSSAALSTQSPTTTDALPSNGSGGGAAHRRGFPLAAAAALGAVLGFLVVSALFCAVWLYLRKRRRALHAVYLPPKRMLSVMSARTVSTVPLFISASEAGVNDDSTNPFRHPRDADEDDPFDAASLASTLSICMTRLTLSS